MVHKSIRLVHAVILVFSASLAFLLVMNMDEVTPLQANASVTVTSWNQREGAGQLREEIADFAVRNGITVAQLIPDLRDHKGRRHLYLVDGDPSVPGEAWLRDGYPDFSRAVSTEVHPFGRLTDHTLLGQYEVFSDPDKAVTLAAFLQSKGAVAAPNERWTVRTLSDGYGGSGFTDAWLMTGLLVVTLTGAGVLLSTRAYGVGRLQGLSGGQLLMRDLRQTARFWALTAAAVSVTAIVGLTVFNGLAGFARYALAVLVIAAPLLLATLAAHALTLWLTFRVGVLAAVKGELPGRTASFAAYAIRVPVLALALMLLSQAMTAAADLNDRERSYDAYAKLGQTSILTEGNAYTEEDQEKSERVLGPWLRKEDRAGHVIVASRSPLASDSPGGAGREVLIVNEAFLDAQHVLDAQGQRFSAGRVRQGSAKEPPVRVLVPKSFGEERESIVRSVVKMPIRQTDAGTTPRFESELVADSQKVFAYTPEGSGPVTPGSWSLEASFVQNPIIVVFPSRLGLLSDLSYTAFATQGGVLFPDPSHVQAARDANPALARQIVAVTPVAEQVAQQMRTLYGEFRLMVFSAVAGAAVLVITGLGACMTHARRNAQNIFARHVTGWRFTTTHRVLLGVETAAVAALLAWGPFQVWRDNRELDEFARLGIPAPFPPSEMSGAEWAAAGSLAVLCLGSVLWSLAVFHRRIVKEGASEA
ncbi:hypothetical protein [Streptomyces cinereospinus]|uniref:ABC transporter permease n=1 Tax=Streptomyces cinereospinus TaxID=285561 RepID=A0ABV5MT60_9ACTN